MLCGLHQRICSSGGEMLYLIHLLSPLLSLFFSLLPVPHKCLINICEIVSKWINVRWTAAEKWAGLKSLFLQDIFPTQPSPKPALCEITYWMPVAISLKCKLLGAKPLFTAVSPAPRAMPGCSEQHSVNVCCVSQLYLQSFCNWKSFETQGALLSVCTLLKGSHLWVIGNNITICD